jgi:hypothetical protein
MRRKRRGKSAPAVRPSDEVTAIVASLAETAGWSEGATLAFLANAGWNAVGGKGDKIAGYRELMKAAVEHHEAEMTARKKLAATSSKLREARKALTPPTKRR